MDRKLTKEEQAILDEEKSRRKAFLADAAAIRKRLDAKAREIQAEKDRIAREKKEAEEAARQRAIDEEKESKEWTNDYFDLNHALRKTIPDQKPSYVGERIELFGAWIPHGEGKLFLWDNCQYEGSYFNGLMSGHGKFVFSDESVWTGGFLGGDLHGSGTIRYPDKTERCAIMFHNEVICFQDELVDGTLIEMDDLRVQAITSFSKGRGARGIITKHIRNWRYQVRFVEDMVPRERHIDLSRIGLFRVLRSEIGCHCISEIGVALDMPLRYDYIADTYGKKKRDELLVGNAASAEANKADAGLEGAGRAGSSSSGRKNSEIDTSMASLLMSGSGGRFAPEMRSLRNPPLDTADRFRSSYKENVFESAAAGVGAAKEQQSLQAQKARSMQQWVALVEFKRREEEKQRRAEIESELK